MSWLTKLIPKKQINISELAWENEREKKRIAAEQAALGILPEEPEEDEIDENGEYAVLERDIYPERIVCPECGNIVFEGSESCRRCGKEL